MSFAKAIAARGAVLNERIQEVRIQRPAHHTNRFLLCSPLLPSDFIPATVKNKYAPRSRWFDRNERQALIRQLPEQRALWV